MDQKEKHIIMKLVDAMNEQTDINIKLKNYLISFDKRLARFEEEIQIIKKYLQEADEI